VKSRRRPVFFRLVCCSFVCCGHTDGNGAVNIFNIRPRYVDKGKGYFEFDYLPQAPGDSTRWDLSMVTYNADQSTPGCGWSSRITEFGGVNFPTYHNRSRVTYLRHLVLPAATSNPIQKVRLSRYDDEGITTFGRVVVHTPLNQRTGR